MAPRNNFTTKREQITVFDADKNPVHVSRANARELVATGNYFWDTADIGKDRIESDGPADPSATFMDIYDSDGQKHSVSRANARDMTGEYTWVPKQSETPEPEPVPEPVVGEALTEEVVTEGEHDLDPVNSPLAAIAAKVTGDADVVAYLDGFPVDTLRDMASRRYGEKIHHRAAKDSVIAKIIDFEDAKLDAEDAAE